MAQPQLPPDAMILQLAMGRWISQSLTVAARLGIADLLAEGPVTVTKLAEQTTSHEESLFRLLRALASVGVFTETAPQTFANTPMSDALRSDAPNSMRRVAIFFNDPWQLDTWSKLEDCVGTGKNAPGLTGTDLFALIGKNPEFLANFQGGMSDISRGASKAVLASYDFSGIGTLADIAGGHGLLLTDILRANAGLKGMLFERPEVLKGAQAGDYLKGLESRVALHSGNFFESVPAGADAYMMKHILHDWTDDQCTTILSNIRAVIPSTGRLLLIEAVIPPGNDPHPAKWIDIEMMVNPGGKERTEQQWTALLAAGGFRLNRIVPTPSLFCVIEAMPV